jgi:hypothetical protein
MQISDIHMDHVFMTRERLTSIVAQVNALAANFMVITGDFITGHPLSTKHEDLIAALSGIRLPCGAILGNHDHWVHAPTMRGVIHNSGLIDLNNRVHSIRRGAEALHIAGVDDIWEKQHRLDVVLAALPADGAAILLAHEPDYADTSAAAGRFDLQLSGHSHGGQVSLPLLGAPVLPYLGQKYPAGLYRVGTMLQYTNRGVGMVSPQVRFACRPEITLFTLRSASR